MDCSNIDSSKSRLLSPRGAIFYKEWIKTRLFYLLVLVVSMVLCGYTFLNVNRILTLKGATHIWEVMLTRDAIFIQLLHYVPLIIGLMAALVQFLPEMLQKRIKLMLHLPHSNYFTVGYMLLYGSVALIFCFSLNLVSIYCFMSYHFASELVWHILLTALPWYLAGLLAYLLASWVILEPSWRMRLVDLLISTALLRLFFLSDKPEAYNCFLPYLLVLTLFTVCLPFLSVSRFKAGIQD